MKILIVLGSIREGRVGDKMATYFIEQVTQRNPDFQYELLDLKDYPMKLYQEALHPAMLNGKSSDDYANAWIKKVAEADGYLIITPEYNRGTSGALKNAIDYPYNEWHKKPVAFVGYGGLSGGARAVEQLRLNFLELQTIPIRESFLVQFVNSKIADGHFIPDNHLASAATKMLDQLERYTQVLKNVRNQL